MFSLVFCQSPSPPLVLGLVVFHFQIKEEGEPGEIFTTPKSETGEDQYT